MGSSGALLYFSSYKTELFSFQNNTKNIDLSNKIFVVILERENPRLKAK